MTAMPRNENAAPLALAETLREGVSGAPASGRALFLCARAEMLEALSDAHDWQCVQNLKPLARELEQQGHAVSSDIETLDGERFALTVLLPPRQRDEARAWLARAVQCTHPDGVVVAAMPNIGGARSGERDLQQLTGTVHHVSRRKCRVFWSDLTQAHIDPERLSEWCALDALRPILDGRFLSRPGLFAWDRIDAASALLAAHLPASIHGRVADLGAGYGFLSVMLLERAKEIEALDLYEADARALEPARRNIERAVRDSAHAAQVDVHWRDVTQGLPAEYDFIVSNPPFHQGRADRPELGQAFIRTAASALSPRGALWLVANRHLPYEATLAHEFETVRTHAEQGGFKVIEAVRGRRGARG
jgi:16S rRNA (guanine1207-N2)-methyltransferase